MENENYFALIELIYYNNSHFLAKFLAFNKNSIHYLTQAKYDRQDLVIFGYGIHFHHFSFNGQR